MIEVKKNTTHFKNMYIKLSEFLNNIEINPISPF